jgi:hypothetical protein
MRANHRQFRVVVQCVVAVAFLLRGGANAFAQGTSDGITVHGHWTIDVKNPDGRVASHHEFENALSSARNVSRWLTHENITFKGWNVTLSNGSSFWNIGEPAVSTIINLQSTNLTVARSGPNADQVVLQGSVQIPSSVSISSVFTVLVITDSTGSGGDEFSHRDLAPAIVIQSGQLVQVTVVLSFS